MASFGGHPDGAPSKITKPRAKKMVKPILKKLQSRSEKNSLDLDRGWEEQSVEKLEPPSALGWSSNYGARSQSARDVSFVLGTDGSSSGAASTAGAGSGVGGGNGGGNGGGMGVAGVGGGGGGGSGTGSSSVGRAKFQHGRSASQASTGSTSRGAFFVHPFQQTPRTSTPPLSYANSLASFDNGRDYSPTITENEDDGLDHTHTQTHHSNPAAQSHHLIHPHHPPPTLSQSNLRRPSLASQRTSSFSDASIPAAPPLRVNTGRSTPAPASRLAHGGLSTTASHSDLHLNLTLAALESPTGTVAPPSLTSPTASCASNAGPMSPLRSSLEAAAFPRLRSRSELDTASRAENIRAARLKFEERERAKEEKYDREMIRKRERRDTKHASRIEKESAAARKGSMSDVSQPPQYQSHRPSASRKTTPTSLSVSSSNPPGGGASLSLGKGFWNANSSRDQLGRPSLSQNDSEKTASETKQVDFLSRKYESVPADQTALPAFGTGIDDVRFEPARPRRGSTAKRKTQSYWQGFILWLRTKLLRINGRIAKTGVWVKLFGKKQEEEKWDYNMYECQWIKQFSGPNKPRPMIMGRYY